MFTHGYKSSRARWAASTGQFSLGEYQHGHKTATRTTEDKNLAAAEAIHERRVGKISEPESDGKYLSGPTAATWSVKSSAASSTPAGSPRLRGTLHGPIDGAEIHDREIVHRPLAQRGAAFSRPAPEVAAAGHDRTIINIKPEHVDAWLNPDASDLATLQAIFDDKRHPYYEHREAA